MSSRSEELAWARRHCAATPFEGLSAEQMSLIMERGRVLYKWFKKHHSIHNLINFVVIAGILGADYFVLIRLPRVFFGPLGVHTVWNTLLAIVVCGLLHSWLIYSLGVYSLHEGAAHRIIFVGSGLAGRVGQFIGTNLCRFGASEPAYYSACHMSHHAKFGSDDDSEFVNFVTPRRYWMTFFPLASFINYSDFVIHRPPTYTRGRVISAIVGATYNGAYAYAAYRLFGLPFALLTMLFLPHVGFWLDRLRQYTEHNLMPLENKDGARSFGIGFWGILVGGGPWGQPCHWAHHLVASIPWYQQILLHRYIVSLLTPQQRAQFLIEPVIGFPKLWWRLLRESNRLLRGTKPAPLQASQTGAGF